MLLAINVGNTHIAVGLCDQDGWRARWRLASDAHRTADEYSVLLDALIKLHGLDAVPVAHAAIASVVPSLTADIVAAATRLCAHGPLLVGPGTPTGMAVRYDTPGALGTDRLVTSVAARASLGAPVIVVDFGTATTFNVVDPEGALAGGAIAPGVGVAADALAGAGARLRRIDVTLPGTVALVGRDTEQSMRSGIVFGYAGLVEGMLERLAAELAGGTNAPVIATGGLAGVLAPLVGRIRAVEPNLALDGLKHIAQLNREVSWSSP